MKRKYLFFLIVVTILILSSMGFITVRTFNIDSYCENYAIENTKNNNRFVPVTPEEQKRLGNANSIQLYERVLWNCESEQKIFFFF